ncbi:MAG: hypothetical protein KGJ11_00010 [Candidatus Omnitrophica bacterium]|nr:hypothetical protein [Candidatus Omnitrophota bacterium]
MKQAITQTDLNQFTGTTRYFQHWSGRIKYTDGIFFVAEAAEAYWLIDLIASYQPLDVNFQVWKLHKEGDFYSVECVDGDDVPVIKQDLDFTDFPEDIMPFEVYVQNGVLFLPSEY